MPEFPAAIAKLNIICENLAEKKALQIDLNQIIKIFNEYGIDWVKKDIWEKIRKKEYEFVTARKNGSIIGFVYLERKNEGGSDELVRVYGPFWKKIAAPEDCQQDFLQRVDEIYQPDVLIFISAQELVKEVLR